MNNCIDSNFDKRSSVTIKGGRPYLYSPKELSNKMISYFRKCVDYDFPFTITALCFELGISRMEFHRLGKSLNDQFCYIIEKGRLIIQMYLEIQCHLAPNPGFAIFLLKNMGWSDKHMMRAETNQGLSAEERFIAQQKIANFSE